MINDVTLALQLNLYERMKKSRFEVVVTSYVRSKNFDDEIKNIAGQTLTYNPKEFLLTSCQ